MNTIQNTAAAAPAVRPAAAARSNETKPGQAAMGADRIQLSTGVKAQAAAPAAAEAPEQTLKQKIVKRGMAGVCGTAGAAVCFIGIIAALEFGIGVPAAHAILPLAAPLLSFVGALLGGWLGFRQGKKWVG